MDLIVTSPPYFGLRSYTDGGEHYPGQIGSEPSPAEFLTALWTATAEMKRVLKPGGSIFVNLGDKYAGHVHPGNGEGGSLTNAATHRDISAAARARPKPTTTGVRDKSLLLLPEAYRLGCTGMLAALGGPDPGLNLIARAVIVWDKPNGLPESVRDRVRRSHEDWVYLTKRPRYYSAVDEIREPHSPVSIARAGRAYNAGDQFSVSTPNTLNPEQFCNPLGKLPGSVWSVASEPLRLPEHLGVDHYAAFPSEWPRRLILGWSPPGICTGCGQGRVPVVDKRDDVEVNPRLGELTVGRAKGTGGTQRSTLGRSASETGRSILGYACACTPHTDHPGSGGSSGPRYASIVGDELAVNFGGGNGSQLATRPKVGPWREYHLTGWTPPPTRPAVVLDPFCGTGTTIMCARALGRYGIGVDLSLDYLRLARWRVWEGHGVQRVRDRTWPPPKRRKPRRTRGSADGVQLRLL